MPDEEDEEDEGGMELKRGMLLLRQDDDHEDGDLLVWKIVGVRDHEKTILIEPSPNSGQVPPETIGPAEARAAHAHFLKDGHRYVSTGPAAVPHNATIFVALSADCVAGKVSGKVLLVSTDVCTQQFVEYLKDPSFATGRAFVRAMETESRLRDCFYCADPKYGFQVEQVCSVKEIAVKSGRPSKAQRQAEPAEPPQAHTRIAFTPIMQRGLLFDKLTAKAASERQFGILGKFFEEDDADSIPASTPPDGLLSSVRLPYRAPSATTSGEGHVGRTDLPPTHEQRQQPADRPTVRTPLAGAKKNDPSDKMDSDYMHLQGEAQLLLLTLSAKKREAWQALNNYARAHEHNQSVNARDTGTGRATLEMRMDMLYGVMRHLDREHRTCARLWGDGGEQPMTPSWCQPPRLGGVVTWSCSAARPSAHTYEQYFGPDEDVEGGREPRRERGRKAERKSSKRAHSSSLSSSSVGSSCSSSGSSSDSYRRHARKHKRMRTSKRKSKSKRHRKRKSKKAKRHYERRKSGSGKRRGEQSRSPYAHQTRQQPSWDGAARDSGVNLDSPRFSPSRNAFGYEVYDDYYEDDGVQHGTPTGGENESGVVAEP